MKFRRKETVDAVQFTGHNRDFIIEWLAGVKVTELKGQLYVGGFDRPMHPGNWIVKEPHVSVYTDEGFHAVFEAVS